MFLSHWTPRVQIVTSIGRQHVALVSSRVYFSGPTLLILAEISLDPPLLKYTLVSRCDHNLVHDPTVICFRTPQQWILFPFTCRFAVGRRRDVSSQQWPARMHRVSRENHTQSPRYIRMTQEEAIWMVNVKPGGVVRQRAPQTTLHRLLVQHNAVILVVCGRGCVT